MAVVTIALQHRSVWAATLAALIFGVRGSAKVPRLVFAGLLVGVLSFSVWNLGLRSTDAGRSLSFAVSEPVSKDSTMGWRFDLWLEFLGATTPKTSLDALVGHPYGAQFIRWQPHNAYVQAVGLHGPVGFLLYIVPWFVVLRRLYQYSQFRQLDWLPVYPLFLIILSSLVYMNAYWPSYEQGLALGAGIALCFRLEPAKQMLARRQPPVEHA